MRVLVGCEESGAVRNAFLSRGHDAWSNDVIDTRSVMEKHLKMDVFKAIDSYGPWDIIILHPPCTALAYSGNSTYGAGMRRESERPIAKDWTKNLWVAACNVAQVGVCLENPAGVLWSHIGVTPQYIQPWQFGHMEQKKTGLALHNLPKLVGTKNVHNEMMLLPKNVRERLYYLPPSPDRAKLRSETYRGIAEAMAEQWGQHGQFR